MLLPADFKSVIADTFYDKQVTWLVVTETNVNGWIEKTTVDGDTFMANVRFNDLRVLQSELGLTEDINIAMTCLPETVAVKGDLFRYGGNQYMVTEAVPFDSHKLIVGRVWA